MTATDLPMFETDQDKLSKLLMLAKFSEKRILVVPQLNPQRAKQGEEKIGLGRWWYSFASDGKAVLDEEETTQKLKSFRVEGASFLVTFKVSSASIFKEKPFSIAIDQIVMSEGASRSKIAHAISQRLLGC